MPYLNLSKNKSITKVVSGTIAYGDPEVESDNALNKLITDFLYVPHHDMKVPATRHSFSKSCLGFFGVAVVVGLTAGFSIAAYANTYPK